jgi:hypothetical protein
MSNQEEKWNPEDTAKQNEEEELTKTKTDNYQKSL